MIRQCEDCVRWLGRKEGMKGEDTIEVRGWTEATESNCGLPPHDSLTKPSKMMSDEDDVINQTSQEICIAMHLTLSLQSQLHKSWKTFLIFLLNQPEPLLLLLQPHYIHPHCSCSARRGNQISYRWTCCKFLRLRVSSRSGGVKEIKLPTRHDQMCFFIPFTLSLFFCRFFSSW